MSSISVLFVVRTGLQAINLVGGGGGRVIVLSATFNNISVISWRSVLLLEETAVPGENHRPVENH